MNPMNLLQRFASRFRKNQRVYVFFICFVIAALFWLLLVLTKDYSSSLHVKVSYSDFPSGLIPVNRLPDRFFLNIKASGYNLISLHEDNQINVDVATLLGPEKGVRKIASRALMHDVAQQLGTDVSILSIQPDTVVFDLSLSTSVRLPIKANLDVTFDRQYDSLGGVQLNPDSVTASIPVSSVGTITSIETEKIKAQSLRAPLKTKAKLISPDGVTLDTSETEVLLEVEKFTEGTVEVPVKLVNVPSGLTIKIYPDKVTLKYLVSLSHYSEIKPEMFTVTADASSVSSDKDEKLDVEIKNWPAGLRAVTSQPQQVDFILKK
jgi:YbbR domain-containing protein